MSIQLEAHLPKQLDAHMLAGTQAVLASVSGWWASKANQAGLHGRWADVTLALEAQPPAEIPNGSALRGINESTTPSELGQLYVGSLADEERSREGKHYTPSVLADRLWEMTRASLNLPRGRDRRLPGLIRDPACGAGALLLPPLREHLRAAFNDEPAITIRGLGALINGVDMDPWSAWLTNVVLGAEALRTLSRVPDSRRQRIPVMAEAGDGLAAGRELATATVMNPPYGRLRLTEDVRADFAHVLYGHANIYALFMASGADNTAQDGVLSCLVPTSFTAGRYFHKLRAHLAETMPVHSINFVDGRNGVFAGVLQETCLVTFRRKRAVRIKVTRSNGEIEQVADVPQPKGDRPWILPRESRDASIAAAAAKLPLTLETAGWHAATGPLVWNRRRDDLYSRSSSSRAVVVWAADIESGRIERASNRNSMRFLALTVKSDSHVMILNEPAVLVQRTTSPEQSRRLVAADLSQDTLDGLGGRVVIENHLNVLRPIVAKPLISRAALARLLQTRTVDRLMRCVSGSVAVSSYEVDSLPLPNAAILASWESLFGIDLEKAVAAVYYSGAKK